MPNRLISQHITNVACALILCVSLAACRRPVAAANTIPTLPIVGTWLIQTPEAPFPLHLFIFHADGTVQQSNPDAGDPDTSDSNLMGAWEPEGDHIRGRVVELRADRITHRYVSRGEISFILTATADTLNGKASVIFYSPQATHSAPHAPPPSRANASGRNSQANVISLDSP